MPFRDRFSCLWCGADHACRGDDDLEGWARLCPACLGRAGDNEFLRGRLRAGLGERARAEAAAARREPGRDQVGERESSRVGREEGAISRLRPAVERDAGAE